MTILIVGATGVPGRRVVRSLPERGAPHGALAGDFEVRPTALPEVLAERLRAAHGG